MLRRDIRRHPVTRKCKKTGRFPHGAVVYCPMATRAFRGYRIRMNRLMLAAVATLVFGLGVAAQTPPARRAPKTTPASAKASQTPMAVAHPPSSSGVDSQNAMVKQYCAGCHSQKR